MPTREDQDDDLAQADPPRVMSHEAFQFNFKVSLASQVRARGGAPSWSRRKKRLDDRLARFWREQTDRAADLWIAAGEGRIAEDGREIRQALLDGSGRDKLAERDHKWRLFKNRADRAATRVEEFNRAWRAHLDRLRLGDLTRRIEDFNKYFPVEANLPVDPVTERFVWMGAPWQPVESPNAAAVLERIPFK